MIRYRRAVPFALGTAASLFGPAWKFRVVVSCPPGETVAVRPVRESSPKDPYVFGPGDSGWITFNVLHSGILIEKQSGASTASVDVWWADERTDEVQVGAALVTSPIGNVIYDSGSVAGGVAINSGVLDLSTLTNIEVIVDNTAGTALRDLSLLSYLADGATQIDSLVLRRCAFGAAANGSLYAPGALRGYIGPNPPPAPLGTHLLYDVTSAANTALDTGLLNTEGAAFVSAYARCSAGTSQLNAGTKSDDAVTNIPITGTGAANLISSLIVGPGLGASSPVPGATQVYSPMPVPRQVYVQAGAAGVGNTVRLVVYAHGPTPGSFAQQMALPTRAKLALGAGGAGAARVTVIGR